VVSLKYFNHLNKIKMQTNQIGHGQIKTTINDLLLHDNIMSKRGVEETNIRVYKTRNLDLFVNITGNRVVIPQHIRKIADSFKADGVLKNPIIVNEKFEVIDGGHRCEAARLANSELYFIVLEGYGLSQVQTLNLNQENWKKKDFMESYANQGMSPYIKLRTFKDINKDFTLNDCIALCSNITSISCGKAGKVRGDASVHLTEVFEDGTWVGKNFVLAQEWVDKIRQIKPYYAGYNRSIFVGTIVGMFMNPNFDFDLFIHKLRLQQTKLVDCSNREQYKVIIEEIYNFRSQNKVNLRFL